MKTPELPMRGLRAALASLAPIVLAGTVLAAQAPINISADRATYEGGTGIYEGNVELTQGALSIKASRLVIDEQNREVNRILALGEPAVLTQNDGTVRAQANSIEYFVKNDQVILTEGALIQQQGSEIRGNKIVYDSQKQTVLAESSEGDGTGRVNMTLQPQKRSPSSEPEVNTESPQTENP